MARVTLRQFLDEIRIERGDWSRRDGVPWSSQVVKNKQDEIDSALASARVATADRLKEWKPLPFKFPVAGFRALWRRLGSIYQVILVDERELPAELTHMRLPSKVRVAISVELEGREVKLLTGNFSAVSTELLSSSEMYRGFGLAALLYASLVRQGQILMSSDRQTPGGRSTWQKTIEALRGEATAAILVDHVAARKIARQHPGPNEWLIRRQLPGRGDEAGKTSRFNLAEHQFLVTGPAEKIFKLAYSSSYSRLVIFPRGMIDQHLELAIKVA